MSTKQKRGPRTKQAESKPADEKSVESKPVESKPAESKPADEKPAETKQGDKKTARKKAADKPAVDKPAAEVAAPAETAPPAEVDSADCDLMFINPARVRAHLDRFNLNSLVDAKIAEFKELQSKCAEGSPEHQRIGDQLAALSHERVRFSSDASTTLASICETIVRQLLTFAMDKSLEAQRHHVLVDALHSGGIEKLATYQLIRTLPLFVSRKERIESASAEARRAYEVAAAVAAAERELLKQNDLKVGKQKKVGVVKAAKVVGDEQSTKTSFKTYVKNVYMDVRASEKYKGLYLSNDLKNYLSELLVEFIKRLSQLVYLTTTVMKNKTVNPTAILKTVESLMIDTHKPHEVIDLVQHDEEKDGKSVTSWTAVRKISYPDSGYDELFGHLKTQRKKETPVEVAA